MVKENSYINIQAFMVNDLHLKGIELIVYAIIFGFSQDGESEFSGSLQYLADWTCSTKQGVMKALQSLGEKKLILKNVEYKNNIRFCTYKSTVLNKVEQGIKQSLPGYTTEFNGGIQQSLPNNIYNNINNTLEHTQEACASYLQEPKFNSSKDYQTFIKDSFSLIAEHNKNAKKKIPISKDILFFSQKEGRDLIELSKQYEPEEILKALKNYLKVANSDTWKSGFSFRAFCKNLSEYTTDFFDISKYIEIKESDEDIQVITQKFADEWMKEKWFDYAVFHRHRKEWLEAGKPEKEEFVKWADKVYAEDNKKGLIY